MSEPFPTQGTRSPGGSFGMRDKKAPLRRRDRSVVGWVHNTTSHTSIITYNLYKYCRIALGRANPTSRWAFFTAWQKRKKSRFAKVHLRRALCDLRHLDQQGELYSRHRYTQRLAKMSRKAVYVALPHHEDTIKNHLTLVAVTRESPRSFAMAYKRRRGASSSSSATAPRMSLCTSTT